MFKKIGFFCTIICLLLLVDNSKQSRTKQTMMAAKAIGNTIKNPQFRNIGNAIKNPMVKTIGNPIKKSVDMFRRTKSGVKTLAGCFEQRVLGTKHKIGKRAVKYLEGGAVKKFKHGTPQAFKEVMPLINTKGKKSLWARSAAQIGAKELRSLGKKSTEYIRGKEFGSLINMISKTKPILPFMLAAGGLERLTHANLAFFEPERKEYVKKGEEPKMKVASRTDPEADKREAEKNKKPGFSDQRLDGDLLKGIASKGLGAAKGAGGSLGQSMLSAVGKIPGAIKSSIVGLFTNAGPNLSEIRGKKTCENSISQKVNMVECAQDIFQKRVLIRLDLDVYTQGGMVHNNRRILEAIPTLRKLIQMSPKGITIMSHMGNPMARPIAKYSLEPVARELEKLLGRKVNFIDDAVSGEAIQRTQTIQDGEIVMLENLRYHLEEEGEGYDRQGGVIRPSWEEIKIFRQKLSSMGDIYINDAFRYATSVSSSIVGIDLPVKAAGLLMQKEFDFFGTKMENPKRPLLCVMEGDDVTNKYNIVVNLLNYVDEMIISDAMAFPFLKVTHKMKTGRSMYSPASDDLVKNIIKIAKKKGVKLHLPIDYEQVSKFDMSKDRDLNAMMLDQGPKTFKKFVEVINKAETIVWNGPRKEFDVDKFKVGSVAMAHAIAEKTDAGGTSIVGGIGTVSLIEGLGPNMPKRFSHLSSCGEQSDRLLTGRILPGITHLSNKSDLKPKASNEDDLKPKRSKEDE